MALKKDIVLENGIVVKYHRVEKIDIRINQVILIYVMSYLDDTQRKKEKDFEPDAGLPLLVFTKEWRKEQEYKDNYSIEQVYDYLKTLDEFKGAEDC